MARYKKREKKGAVIPIGINEGHKLERCDDIMQDKKYFGKVCKRCGFSYGRHGSYGANCPRRKGNGERFTNYTFSDER